jgi:rare lipoprotein A
MQKVKYITRGLQLAMCIWCLTSFKATYYADAFNGRVMRSGAIYDMNKLTCASNTHKLGTKLKVTNTENNKSVIVTVTDTGDFKKVTLDLSKKAFSKIAKLEQGVINVAIKKIN